MVSLSGDEFNAREEKRAHDLMAWWMVVGKPGQVFRVRHDFRIKKLSDTTCMALRKGRQRRFRI